VVKMEAKDLMLEETAVENWWQRAGKQDKEMIQGTDCLFYSYSYLFPSSLLGK
jgi:hypothetical protein